MNGVPGEGDPFAEIDAAAQDWRQGDVIRPGVFSYLADTRRPGTPASIEIASSQTSAGPRIITVTTPGFVIISQTCDLVAKPARDAPFVDVAALVELDETKADEARRGDRPRYAWVPQISDVHFADLDQLMTIEKAALIGRRHERGVSSDEEQATLASAISRKFGRFAFPDDVTHTFRKVQSRWRSRSRSSGSPEGFALNAVRQIRVEADPSWQSDQFSVHVIFIVGAGELPVLEQQPQPTQELLGWAASKPRGPAELAERMKAPLPPDDLAWLWDQLVDAWVALCQPHGAVREVTAEVVCADEYTVDRYWRSQRLDLDYLSGPAPEE